MLVNIVWKLNENKFRWKITHYCIKSIIKVKFNTKSDLSQCHHYPTIFIPFWNHLVVTSNTTHHWSANLQRIIASSSSKKCQYACISWQLTSALLCIELKSSGNTIVSGCVTNALHNAHTTHGWLRLLIRL